MAKGIRQENAEHLAQAGDLLQHVTHASVRPVQPIVEALRLAELAYTAARNYASGRDCGLMRVGILRLRGIAQAFERNERVAPGDYALLRETGMRFGELATSIGTRDAEERQRTAAMRHSALGLRFDGVDGVREGQSLLIERGRRVVQATEEHAWTDMEQYRDRLPRRLANGAPFALFRCPLVVFTKSFIGDVALDRAALKWQRGGAVDGVSRGGFQPGAKRITETGPHQLLLGDQILVGFDRARLDADRAEVVQRALQQLQPRMGRLSAGLGEKGRLLVSPGNPLSWLWLVPARVMSATHMVPTEASFPWKTEHVPMPAARREAHVREIDQINQQAAILMREGKSLDAGVLHRQSQLLEELDRSYTPEERRRMHAEEHGEPPPPTLAQRRAAMQTAIDRRCVPVRTKMADLQRQLADLGAAAKSGGGLAKMGREIREQIAACNARITAITDEEMRRARAAMKS